MLKIIFAVLLQLGFGSPALNDMVAGFAGDKDAFTRAMTALETLLDQNPDNAEALVWHGAGTLFQSRLEGETDGQKRIAAFQKGTSEMDRAVKLEIEKWTIRDEKDFFARHCAKGASNENL